MKFKLTKKNKRVLLAGVVASAVFGSSIIVATTSLKSSSQSNIAKNESAAKTKAANQKQADKDDSAKLKEIRQGSTLSREIPVDVTYENIPQPTIENDIEFVNGEGRTVLKFSVDEQSGNVKASMPNELKIFVDRNKTSITSNDFDIAIKTYNSASYSFTEEGFTENSLLSENHLNWTVENNTPPSYLQNDQGSSYIVFDNLGLDGAVVGNLNSGYVEVSVKIRTSGYYGPNRIMPQSGRGYSPFLSTDEEGNLDVKFVFSNIGGKVSTIYNNQSVSNSGFKVDFDWITAQDNISASEFISSGKISTIPATANQIAAGNQNDSRNTPRAYAYANDNNGELNFVVIPPYVPTANANSILSNVSITGSKPIFYTIKGFKKIDNSANKDNVRYINSDDIIITNKTSTNSFISNAKSEFGYHTGFNLSPISLFDFSLKNGLFTIAPNQEMLNGEKFLNLAFNDDSLMDWNLVLDNLPFLTNYNAKTIFTNKFSNTYEQIDYNGQAAILLSTVNGIDDVAFTPISNIFKNYDNRIPGPWVATPDAGNIESTVWKYLNYLRLIDDLGLSNTIPTDYTKSFPLTSLSETNKTIQFKNLFGSALPKILNAPTDKAALATAYADNLALFTDATIDANGKLTKTADKVKNIFLDKFIAFENGPVIVLDADTFNSTTDEPYLFDNTSAIIWNDLDGSSHFSMEAINVFSSQENFAYNESIGFGSEKFGKTAFVESSKNLGISDNQDILPSDFIKTEGLYAGISLNAYNSPLANIKNSTIKMVANDDEGTVQLTIKPMLNASIDESYYGYGVSTKEAFANLTTSQLASLFDVNVTTNNDVEFEFTITGFKKTSNNGASLAENYFNPQAITTNSGILGYDYEKNLEKFANNPNDKILFQEWFIANAIENLHDSYKFFDPKTGKPNPSFFNSTATIGNSIFTDFNPAAFENVIDSWSLVQSEKYNMYKFDVYFKPNTTFDIYNNLNTSPKKLSLTINTSGSYEEWNGNKEIDPGIWLKYPDSQNNLPDGQLPPNQQDTESWKFKFEFPGSNTPLTIDQAIEIGYLNASEYMTVFANLLAANDLGEFELPSGIKGKPNLLRYLQSGAIFDNSELNNIRDNFKAVKETSNYIMSIEANNSSVIGKAPLTLIVDQYQNGRKVKTFPYPLSPTSSPILGQTERYGDSFTSQGKYLGKELNNNLMDPSTWDVKVDAINETSFVLSITPKLWKDGNKFVTDVKPFKISFINVIPESKTTKLVTNVIQAASSSEDVFAVKAKIKAGQANDIVQRIASQVQHRVGTNGSETVISIDVDDSDFNANALAYASEGTLRVDVYASGKWYDNSPNIIEIPPGSKVKLGTVNIVGLNRSSITTVTSNYFINAQEFEANKFLPKLAQDWWVDARNNIDPNNNLRSTFSDDINKWLAKRIFINGKPETKISFQSNHMNSNIFFDNEKGQLILKAGSYSISGPHNTFQEDKLGNITGITKTEKDTISNTDLVISGFTKLKGVTKFNEQGTIEAGNIYSLNLPSLAGTDLSSLNEEKIKQLIIDRNIFTNIPNFDQNAKNFISVSQLKHDFTNGQLEFDFELSRIVVDSIDNVNGKNAFAIVTNGQIPGYGSNIPGGRISGKIKLSGFNKINLPTIVETTGYEILNFYNLIATSFVGNEEKNKVLKYNEANQNVKTLINEILKVNLISNLPTDATNQNIAIAIKEIDNTQGLVVLDVYANNCFIEDKTTNQVILHNNLTEFKLIGETRIFGFKKISGKTEIKNQSITLPAETIIDTANEATRNNQIIELVKLNWYEIFNNPPPVAELSNAGDIAIENVNLNAASGIVTFDLTINKVYVEDQKWDNTPVELTKPTRFNGITFKGFNNAVKIQTSILEQLTLPLNSSLTSLLPSEAYNNQVYRSALVELVWNQAIRGSKAGGSSINDLSLNSYESFSNLNGELTINVSLSKYVKTGGQDSTASDTPLQQTIIIKGFRTSKVTQVDRFYNGIDNQNINTIIASAFTENDIISTLYNYMIHNTTNSFVLSDISIRANSIKYDNLNGSISFIPIIKNYFNSDGSISKTAKEFPQCQISGFKKVLSKTIVPPTIEVTGQNNKLASKYFEEQKEAGIKKLIADSIIGLPEPFDAQTDITISSIQVDNRNGDSSGIRVSFTLNKTIKEDGSISTSASTIYNVSIGGFGSFEETTLPPSMTWSALGLNVLDGVSAGKYYKDNKELIRQRVAANILNKWDGFQDANVKIGNAKIDNIKGEISLEVGLMEYIDEYGNFVKVNIGQEPKIIPFKITNFPSVPVSSVIDRYFLTGMTDKYASDFFLDKANVEVVKNLVWDNLLINKTPQTTKNDIEVVFKRYNNRFGTLFIDVVWKNNYVDESGNTINNSKPTTFTVEISGFKPVNAPTTVANSITLKKDSDLTFESLLNMKHDNAQIKEKLIDLILQNIQNAPVKKYDKADIEIVPVRLEDNQKYLGNLNLKDGEITINFQLKKYFDKNLEYKENPPLVLSTTIKGFNKLDIKPTTVANEIDLSNSNFDGTAFEAFRNITSDQFEPNTEFTKDLIIYSEIITNWQPEKQKMFIELIGVSGNTATIGLKLQNTVSKSGLSLGDLWSDSYVVVIKGFKEIKATTMNGSLSMSEFTSPQLTNYDAGTKYSDINVWDLVKKDPNQSKLSDADYIAQSILSKVVNNPTEAIKNIQESKNILISDYSKYVKAQIVSQDGLNGIVNLKISIYSYYDTNGNLVQGEATDNNKNFITKNVILTGFARTKVTKIAQYVRVNNANSSPSDYFKNAESIRLLITNNINNFFTNLPTTFDVNKIIIQPVSFDNTSGSIVVNITLPTYYNNLGELINNTDTGLTQRVTISGLVKTNETTVRQTLDLKRDFGMQADLTEIETSDLAKTLKTAMITKQNDPTTPPTAKIWKNLPTKQISAKQFSIEFDNQSYNFTTGSATLKLTMNEYYDENGILSTKVPKVFNILVSGFDKVDNITEANQVVDVSGSELAKGSASDVEALGGNGIFSKIDNNVFKKMFNNLPKNATSDNIESIEIIKGTANDKEGTIEINVTINNSFMRQNDGYIIQSNTANEFKKIKLVGLSKVAPTDIVKEFDISKTTLGQKNVASFPFATGGQELKSYLSQNEVLQKILINPSYSGWAGGQVSSLQTELFDLKMLSKNLSEGTIEVGITLKKFIKDDFTTSNPDEKSKQFILKLTGFKKSTPTAIPQASAPTTTSKLSASGFMSEYSGDPNAQIVSILNTQKIFGGAEDTSTATNQTQVIKVVSPNTPAGTKIDDPGLSSNVLVNDITGEIKFKLFYKNYYDNEGELHTEPKLYDEVFTLNNFVTKNITKWAYDTKLSTEVYGGNKYESLIINDDRFYNQNVDEASLADINIQDLVKKQIDAKSPKDEIIVDAAGGWIKDKANGKVSILINISHWKTQYQTSSVENGMEVGSTLIKEETKTMMLEITGFKKENLAKTEKARMSLIYIIGALSGLMVVLIIALLVYKRRFS